MRLQRGFRWINVLNVLRKSQAYRNVPLLGAHMVFHSAPPQPLKLQPGQWIQQSPWPLLLVQDHKAVSESTGPCNFSHWTRIPCSICSSQGQKSGSYHAFLIMMNLHTEGAKKCIRIFSYLYVYLSPFETFCLYKVNNEHIYIAASSAGWNLAQVKQLTVELQQRLGRMEQEELAGDQPSKMWWEPGEDRSPEADMACWPQTEVALPLWWGQASRTLPIAG